ncbi:MAG: LytR C-terminal domain-containing protein [Candidatus Fermentibacteraceae bacterium]
MTAARRKRTARNNTGRIWQVVLGILSGCAITLAVVYNPVGHPSPETRPVIPQPVYDVPSPDTVRVMVMNGTSINGKGREVQRHLEGRSGPVFFIAPSSAMNADRLDYTETVIVSHVPGPAAAAAVAERLGVPDSSIVWCLPLQGAPEVDVTVYLGRDLATRTFMPVTPN